MPSLLAAFTLAAVLSALFTPMVRLAALRIGAVSTPGGRHLHGRTVPRLGGVAIFAAFTLPLVGMFLVESSVASTFRHDLHRFGGLLVGALVMCAVGFLDDTRRVRALYKLYAQIAVALIAWTAGFRIEAVDLPLLGTLPMGVFALPVTIVWIVGVTNAINLIDGLDGLAGGVVFFAALTNLVVARISGSLFVAMLMATTLGSVLGFLFYNFNPARIFMGDSGSYFLGFVLATTSLAGSSQKASTAVSILVPILALGVPIFDTLFAMFRRFLERRSIFSPDRGHIHHRLLDMGVTHRRAVLLLYGVSLACTAAAIGASLGRNWAVGAAMLALSIVMTAMLRFAGSFEQAFAQRRQKARIRCRHTELLRAGFPDFVNEIGRAHSEADVLKALEHLLWRTDLSRVDVLRIDHATEEAVHLTSMTNASVGDPHSQDLVRARYPVGHDGRARAALKFAWHAEHGEVSPQVDILLQLLVDACDARLAQLGSPLAAERVTTAPLESRALSAPTPSRAR